MQFSFHLFILLFGFVIGNLFPTFFGDFLGKVGTPLFLFLALDFFNYFYYSHQRRFKFRQKVPTNSQRRAGGRLTLKNSLPRAVYSFSARANSFKIGFLFGLFVDAFKVGS